MGTRTNKKRRENLSADSKKQKARNDKGHARPENQKAFEEYAQFIALPTNEAIELYGYHTDLAFAAAHKLSNKTLTKWKTYDELWTRRDQTLQGMKRYTAQVMEAMRNQALKGDAAAAKLHLQYIEKWNPKLELAGSVELTGDEQDFG